MRRVGLVLSTPLAQRRLDLTRHPIVNRVPIQNARARHYLGVITSKMGMIDRAEREFKNALAIDPAYGEADFNLAVLYATKNPPNWSDAKKHYNDAVKKGVKADPAMEKLLSGAKG